MYSIRLSGDVRSLMKRLKNLENTDIKGVSLTLAELLRTSTRGRFQAEKGPDGKTWAKSIRASEQGGQTLTDRARLKNSIKSEADGAGFAVGTNTIYARTHQFGDERTIRAKTRRGLVFQVNGQWRRLRSVKVKIPARPFLGISEDDMQEIKATLEAAVAKER